MNLTAITAPPETTILAHDKNQCKITATNSLLLTGYAVLMITGTIGNGLVLIIFRKYWRKGSLIELMILYLAAFDFLSSILTPLLFGYWIFTCDFWYLGYMACKIFPPVVRILSNASVAFLMIMAFDRYIAIVHPFKERFSRRTVHILAFWAMCFSIAWETQYIFYLQIENGKCYTFRTDNRELILDITLCIFRDVIFVVVMLFSTISAYFALHQNDTENGGYKESCDHSDRSGSKRIVVMVILMGVISFVTILPRDIFHLVYNLSRFTTPLPYNEKILSINSFLKLLQTSNCVYNVFIYAGKHRHFRSDLQYMFCRKRTFDVFLRMKAWDKTGAAKTLIQSSKMKSDIVLN